MTRSRFERHIHAASVSASAPFKPLPRQELVETSDRMISDADKYEGEPGLGIDVVEVGGGDQAANDRGALAAVVRTGEQARLAARDTGPGRRAPLYSRLNRHRHWPGECRGSRRDCARHARHGDRVRRTPPPASPALRTAVGAYSTGSGVSSARIRAAASTWLRSTIERPASRARESHPPRAHRTVREPLRAYGLNRPGFVGGSNS